MRWTFDDIAAANGDLIVLNNAGYLNLEMFLAYTAGDFEMLKNEFETVSMTTSPASTTPGVDWQFVFSIADAVSAPPSPWQIVNDAAALNGKAIGCVPGTTPNNKVILFYFEKKVENKFLIFQ